MDKRVDILIALAVLVSGPAWYGWADQLPSVRMSDPVGTAGVPKLVAIGLTLVGVWLVGSQLVQWRSPRKVRLDEDEIDEAGYPVSLARVALLGGAMLAYVYALEPLGSLIATSLFFAVGLLTLGERRPVPVATTALGFTVFVHLVFGILLSVSLPMGPLRSH